MRTGLLQRQTAGSVRRCLFGARRFLRTAPSSCAQEAALGGCHRRDGGQFDGHAIVSWSTAPARSISARRSSGEGVPVGRARRLHRRVRQQPADDVHGHPAALRERRVGMPEHVRGAVKPDRRRVRSTRLTFAEDPRPRHPGRRDAARAARTALEPDGVASTAQRWPTASGSTAVPGGRWRIVFEATTTRPQQQIVLTDLTFGVGHAEHPWQPSAHQVAHRRLHPDRGRSRARLSSVGHSKFLAEAARRRRRPGYRRSRSRKPIAAGSGRRSG